MDLAPVLTARRTKSSGLTIFTGLPAFETLKACEISQFWQYGQCRSHPSIPKVSASVPGKTWKNGFFSIGSDCRAAT